MLKSKTLLAQYRTYLFSILQHSLDGWLQRLHEGREFQANGMLAHDTVLSALLFKTRLGSPSLWLEDVLLRIYLETVFRIVTYRHLAFDHATTMMTYPRTGVTLSRPFIVRLKQEPLIFERTD